MSDIDDRLMEERMVAACPLVKDGIITPEQGAQDAAMYEGQRRINLIWEVTQAVVAILTIGTCMGIFVIQSYLDEPRDFPPTLSNMAFAVLAFYMARTNHSNVGGTGRKSQAKYEGR